MTDDERRQNPPSSGEPNNGDEEALLKQFGAAFRAMRIKAGLTQEQLAEKAETSQATISRVENGVEGPTLVTCLRLVNAGGGKFDPGILWPTRSGRWRRVRGS